MAPAQKLDPPFDLPVRKSSIIPGTIFPSTPVHKDTGKCEFIKHGSPYDQRDRLFVGLSRSWRGIDAIEFKDGSLVGYISHCNTEGKDIPVYHLSQVSHPSLLIAREIFVARGNVYFCYGHWGITLNEIEQLWPVYQLSEVEVALVCKATLEGLRYLHEDLDICYGGLTGENVLITEGGDVRITSIGESLLKKPKSNIHSKAKDIQAVCNAAWRLLRLERLVRVRGTIGLLADDLAGAPPTATADDLLQHPFLQTSAVSWCLRPVYTLCTIAQGSKQDTEII
ncbi:uncharacterized protein ASPGLDRAFT_58636 [Aspergillus glaucus CBS 516.65]|uniref:Protein kinase domain-containing protein n=1 Tax=Aspergillus glaucus CBS 516.65 TaxID=1160497 RepID=A0A1L9VI26_ASPGL|nr:hypothetical protein ASPGLDRAFT_58636 [Aspergillus glaucus CBS 516.65]OJJ83543.1 hypothetical protein ASPGLDRAFT_58636 [Aspergillus glaucus CBS 516.65]